MLVAEEKEYAAYREKIHEIWLIARREGLAKGLMFGGVSFFNFQLKFLVDFLLLNGSCRFFFVIVFKRI